VRALPEPRPGSTKERVYRDDVHLSASWRVAGTGHGSHSRLTCWKGRTCLGPLRSRATRRLAGTASVAVAIVTVLGVVPLAGAAGGDLDPSFGEAGKVITPSGWLAFATAVAVQPDRRIVVGGHGADEDGNTRGTLIRYLSDGSVDRSFGDGGTVVADEGGSVSAVALQRDGRVIVAVGGGIRRFLPGGALDRGFGDGGTAPAVFVGGAYARLVVQPDGRIVVVGNATGGSEVRVARLRRDGTPDPAFGQRGIVRTNANWRALAAALTPDGKIVVAGQWLHPQKAHSGDGLPVELVVARYGRSGVLDATFGRGGVVRHRIDPADNVTTAVAVQRDGRIVVGGRGGAAATGSPRCCGAVWRLLPSGALDRAFGVGGQAVTTTASQPGRMFGSRIYGVQALVVDRGGRIVVTALDEVSPGSRFGVARFTPDGRPDRRFGRDGAVTTSFGGTNDRPWALGLDPAGKIVVAGGTGAGCCAGMAGPRAIALARYLVPPCVVPNLRTRTRQGAAAALRNSGCALGRVTTAFSSEVARGRVISQQHRPLTSLPEDSSVGIVVSRGSRR
jgi:uncharacterized delta-60 repeat protein